MLLQMNNSIYNSRADQKIIRSSIENTTQQIMAITTPIIIFFFLCWAWFACNENESSTLLHVHNTMKQSLWKCKIFNASSKGYQKNTPTRITKTTKQSIPRHTPSIIFFRLCSAVVACNEIRRSTHKQYARTLSNHTVHMNRP